MDQLPLAAPSDARSSASDIKAAIRRYAIGSTAPLVILTALSPLLAGHLYHETLQEPGRADALALRCSWCVTLAGSANPFINSVWFTAVTVGLVLLCSLMFVLLVRLLLANADILDDECAALLRRWACRFGMVSAIAVPVFVQDFWLSIVWGRMAAHGMNPYYDPMALQFQFGVPIDWTGERMTYGPLWAAVSAVTAFVGGGITWIQFVLFKGILALCWLGALRELEMILRAQSMLARCLGMAIMGWLPLNYWLVLADGHNDIAMVYLMLAAFRSLQDGAARSTFYLIGSALIKYVSAPLVALELIHRVRRDGWKRYIRSGLITAAMGVGVFAIFFRSMSFFDPVSRMRNWRLMEPAGALVTFTDSLGPIVINAFTRLVRIVFYLLPIPYFVRYVRGRQFQALLETCFAIMTVVVCNVVGHIWPWFLLWPLAMAALNSHLVLARWMVCISLMFPFVEIWRRVSPNNEQLRYAWPATIVYAVSIVVLALGRFSGFKAKS